MNDALERQVRELGLRVVGGQDKPSHDLVEDCLHAHEDIQRRASRVAKRAVTFHRAERFEEAIGAYRELAKHNRWASEQWARSVSVALGAAADCALRLRRRALAGRFLAVSRMSDSELLGRSPGLLALLGLPRSRGKRNAQRLRKPPPGGRARRS